MAAMLLAAALGVGACGQAAPTTDQSAAPAAGSEVAAELPEAPATPDAAGSEAQQVEATPSSSEPADATSAAVAQASCDRIEQPPLQAGSHLLGDQAPPVPYSSLPPTSGWHASGHLDVGVRASDDRLTEPEQVSVLEAGGVVVAYRGLDAEAMARLKQRANGRYAGRVAVTPYKELAPGAVAFTSWGRLQRCDGLDTAALDRFVERFGPDEPITPGH